MASRSRTTWRAWAITLRDSSSYHLVLEHAHARTLLQLVADGSAVLSVRGRGAVASGAVRRERYAVNMGSHGLELRVRFGAAEADACAYELVAVPSGSNKSAAKDAVAVKQVDGHGDMPDAAKEAASRAAAECGACLAAVALVACLLVLAALPCLAVGAFVFKVAGSQALAQLGVAGVSGNDNDTSSALAATLRREGLGAETAEGSGRAEEGGDEEEERGESMLAAGGPTVFGEQPTVTVRHGSAGCPTKGAFFPALPIARLDGARRLPTAERLRPSWVVPRAQLPPGTTARAAAEIDADAWWAQHSMASPATPLAVPTAAIVRESAGRLLAALGCEADVRTLIAAHARGAVVKGSAEWAHAYNRTSAGGLAAAGLAAAGAAAGEGRPPVLELYAGPVGEDAAGAISSQHVRLSDPDGQVRTCRLALLLEQVRWVESASGLGALVSALTAVAAADSAEVEVIAVIAVAVGGGVLAAAADPAAVVVAVVLALLLLLLLV
ncbi:hypothetical protein T492DRAFT_306210 [Pavlovales sp. CCMP2436]|nr:hypothetical protein T492DRAFT_306210 [Pavlovales sp. CCMP2436]